MIGKDAIRSLKASKSKALFYCLTFYLTSTLMFLFFNMAESATQGKAEIFVTNNMVDLTKYILNGNMGNIMMVFVVVMCSIDIVFTNDFYVRTKAKELAIRLISGATYTQLLKYLLIQTSLMLVVAIPLGVLSGLALIPLINHILIQQGSDFIITIQSFAIVEYISITLFLVFWTTVLNASFAYKNGAVLMLSDNMKTGANKERFMGFYSSSFTQILSKIFWIFVALLPIIFSNNGTGGIAVFVIAGCVGLDHVLKEILLPLFSTFTRKRKMHKPVVAYANGFLRQDILVSGITFYLLIADVVVLIAMMFTRNDTPLEKMLVWVSFIFIVILQSMAIMFRLETDLSSRKREFQILDQTGFEEKQIRQVMNREITLFYGFVLFIALFYLSAVYIALIRAGLFTVMNAVVITGVLVIALLGVYILTLSFYRNSFVKKAAL